MSHHHRKIASEEKPYFLNEKPERIAYFVIHSGFLFC